MKTFLVNLIVCLFLPLVLFGATLNVEAASPRQKNKQQHQQLTIHSSQQAARLVKNRVGGKVLKVQSQRVNGNPGYRVKILKKDGRISSVLVDAKSGRINR